MSLDDRLAKSAALVGLKIKDAGGHKLGVIRELFIDRDAGIVRYVADLTKDRFKEVPAYDRDQLNSATYGWGAQVERFFEAP